MNTKKPAILNCSYHTAGIAFIILGILFLSAGCAGLYKILGLTPEQTAAQIAQDQDATQLIIQQVRWTSHEIITTTLAGLGTILSGLLARWLGTERKITAALITGIEATDAKGTKESVQQAATAAGVQTQLHARVVSLT